MILPEAHAEFADPDKSSPYNYTKIRMVKFWITEGDGNWGFDEIRHILLVCANGRKLHLSDFNPESTFDKACTVLEHFLDLKIDWRGPVWEEYQRYQSQRWWTKFLTGWHHNKLIYSIG